MNTVSNLLVSLRGALCVSAVLLAAGCSQQPEAEAPAEPIATELTAVETPPPQYPMDAACNGNGGTSTLKVTVGTEGVPTDVIVFRGSGNDALDDAAVTAVKAWTFKAATRGGQPVAQTINVPVNFPPPQVRPDACFSLDEKKPAQP
ncbi:energy transducer TonB [Pseudoxanthomonas sp.]|uniref:energy transducer TonB n=1 Tax=Pseudoxanthomonas sp. TaxID=1871049 RepID=UPI002601BCBA|nr:energy transducer TonB [Pseudoxanthomonas sp.]WDS37069.1 MAG: energy transducer TonB [Pseudoxanthomonas sp.]